MSDQQPEGQSQNQNQENNANPNQEQIPFLNEETLQNLANSYKELNDQQNNNEVQIDYTLYEDSNKNFQSVQQIEREEISDEEQTNHQDQQSDKDQPQEQQKQQIQQQQPQQQLEVRKNSQQIALQQDKDIQLQKACCRSCIKKIRGKTCVCVVPASLRKQDISEKGCRTCGCKGCGDEANIKPELQREKAEQQQLHSQQNQQHQQQQQSSQQQSQNQQKPQQQEQTLQNGCCRECMKAFSKTGKSCLCQVPKAVRKFELPANGCNICGCKGCNPGDLRKQQERQQQQYSKHSYSHSHSRSQSHRRYSRHRRSPSYSRSHSRRRHGDRYYRSRSRSHRHRPSIDQPSQFGSKQPQQLQQQSQQQQDQVNFEQMNFSNFQNSVFGQYVQKTLSIFPPLMGFGIPERTPSYILGKPLDNNE